MIGSVAACVACSALAKRITAAKLYHFDSDRDRLFRKADAPDTAISRGRPTAICHVNYVSTDTMRHVGEHDLLQRQYRSEVRQLATLRSKQRTGVVVTGLFRRGA